MRHATWVFCSKVFFFFKPNHRTEWTCTWLFHRKSATISKWPWDTQQVLQNILKLKEMFHISPVLWWRFPHTIKLPWMSRLKTNKNYTMNDNLNKQNRSDMVILKELICINLNGKSDGISRCMYSYVQYTSYTRVLYLFIIFNILH
jgi:hypothetical protein